MGGTPSAIGDTVPSAIPTRDSQPCPFTPARWVKIASARSSPPRELHTISTPYGSRYCSSRAFTQPSSQVRAPSRDMSATYREVSERDATSSFAPPSATTGSEASWGHADGHEDQPGGQLKSARATCPPKLPMRRKPLV